jgi:hypothetical protein
MVPRKGLGPDPANYSKNSDLPLRPVQCLYHWTVLVSTLLRSPTHTRGKGSETAPDRSLWPGRPAGRYRRSGAERSDGVGGEPKVAAPASERGGAALGRAAAQGDGASPVVLALRRLPTRHLGRAPALGRSRRAADIHARGRRPFGRVSRASSCQTVGLALRLHLEDEIEDDRLRAVSRLAQVRVLWNGERIHQLFLLPAEKKVIVPEDVMRSGGIVAPASNTGGVRSKD